MKTSKAHFKGFVNECKRWITFWGLHQWRVSYQHKDLKNNNGECEWLRTAKVAVIRLSKIVDDQPQIKMTAFHEVDELRFARIRDLAMDRTATEDQIDEAIHELIRQDENLIFKTARR